MPHALTRSIRHTRGASTVEFALSCIAFFTLFLGAFEVARYAYVRNAAAEATRVGARMAAACSIDADNAIRTAMHALVPQIPANDETKVVISQKQADKTTDCTATSDCAYVTVTVSGVAVETAIPLMPVNLVLPTTSSTVPREFLNSTNNDFCK